MSVDTLYRQLFGMTGTVGAGDPFAQAGGEGGGAAPRDPNFEYTPTGGTDSPQYTTAWAPQDGFMRGLQEQQAVGFAPRVEGSNNPSYQFSDEKLPQTHGMSFSQLAPVGPATKLFNSDYKFDDPNYGLVTDKKNINPDESMFDKLAPMLIAAALTAGMGGAIGAVGGAGALGGGAFSPGSLFRSIPQLGQAFAGGDKFDPTSILGLAQFLPGADQFMPYLNAGRAVASGNPLGAIPSITRSIMQRGG